MKCFISFTVYIISYIKTEVNEHFVNIAFIEKNILIIEYFILTNEYFCDILYITNQREVISKNGNEL